MENLLDAPYEYQGVPLTPTIAQVLIREMFAGQIVERQVLIEEAVREHVKRGGTRASAQDVTKVFKVALGALRDAGEATNPSHGYWRIHGAGLIEALPAGISQPAQDPEPVADLEIGQGSEAVYVYYLPTYRMLSEGHGEASWPCKIGRTRGDPLARVMSQASTALPERPHVALVIRSSFAAAWEAALHGVLTLRGRRIDESPGAEWFLTSPAEVMRLAMTFDRSLEEIRARQEEEPPDERDRLALPA